MTTADLILQTMMHDFREHMYSKIEEVLKININDKFLLSEVFDSDPKVYQLMDSIASMSKYHISLLVDILIKWRKEQLQNIDNLISSKFSQSKDNNIIEERLYLSIEYIFCKLILQMLETNPLKIVPNDDICSEIEDIAFLHFTPQKKYEIEGEEKIIMEENRNKIPNLYSKIIGILSERRLKHIIPRFLKEVTFHPVRSKKSLNVIHGIRYVRLHLFSVEGIEIACTLIPKLIELYKLSQRIEVKQGLSDVIVGLLKDCSLQSYDDNSLDFSQWHQTIFNLFNSMNFQPKKVKSKDAITLIPITTALLCVAKKSDFKEQYWEWMKVLLSYGIKEQKTKSISLECILLLLDTFLHKFGESSVNVPELDEIATHVFQNITPKKGLTKTDTLEIYVNIAYAMSLLKFSFTIEHVICRLLSFQSNSFQPERVIVAVRTIRLLKEGTVLKSSHSSHRESIKKNLAAYWDSLMQYWAQAMLHLDSMLGNLLYSTQVKTLYDLIRSDKEYVSIELLQLMLECIPMAIPKIESQKLLYILTKYLLHLDKGISENTSNALMRLMSKSEFRVHVINTIAEYSTTLSHNRFDLIFTMLFKLSQLFKKWISILKSIDSYSSTSQVELESLLITKIESITMIFLCSPKAKTRLLSLEILKSIRSIQHLLIKTSSSDSTNYLYEMQTLPTRVIDIIEEAGPDVLKDLQKESSFLKPLPIKVKTLEKLAAKESREDQQIWSYALGELLEYLNLLQPETTFYSFLLIQQRFKEIKFDDKENFSISEQTEMLYWWRNYIIFLCSTMPPQPSSEYQCLSSRDVLSILLPYLKSNNDSYREAIVMALQRTNYKSLSILFESLKTYEKEFQGDNDKKKKSKRDRIRFEVTSIYSFISETTKRSIFIDQPTLKPVFISFIQEAFNHLSPNKNLMDKLHLRYEFCILVRHVMNALHLNNEIHIIDDGHLRKKIFYLLNKWCLIDKETVNKDIQSILVNLKDPEKRKKYGQVLEDQLLTLQNASALTIASCVQGPMFESILIDGKFLKIVDALLTHPQKTIQSHSSQMLENILRGNYNQPHLIEYAITQSYHNEHEISSKFFFCFTEIFPYIKTNVSKTSIYHLIIFKFGDYDVNVRRTAHELLLMEKSLTNEEELWENIPFVIESSLFTNYQKAQLEISHRLSKAHPDLSIEMINEMYNRLESLDILKKKELLNCVIPWLKNVQFKSMLASFEDIFNKFIKISLDYKKDLLNEIGEIWSTLGQNLDNVNVIINKLLEISIQKQDTEFILLVKLICVYLSRGSSKYVVDYLINEIKLSSNSLAYSSKQLTRVHLALIILTQLTYEISDQLTEHLALIFHLAILGIDNPNPLVYEHCRMILTNLIHSLIIIPLETFDERRSIQQDLYEEVIELEEYLKANSGYQLWPSEDITIKKTEIKSTEKLTSLVQTIVHIFSASGAKSNLSEEWADYAIKWAVRGVSWHITGRSFQIYRALSPTITKDAQNDLLECLFRSTSYHNTLRASKESLAMILEVLVTLQSLVKVQSSEKLILFPQIFWASVAMLLTDYEQHYLHALKLFHELILRFNFNDKYVQNVFEASIPKDWNPPFKGILPLIVRGLYSNIIEFKSIEVLADLILIPFGEILIDGDPLLYLIFSLIPYVSTNFKTQKKFCSDIAERFSIACSMNGLSNLQSVFQKLSKYEFESIEEFMNELKDPLTQILKKSNIPTVLSLLFSFLESGPSSWRKSILLLIHAVLKFMFKDGHESHSKHVKNKSSDHKRKIPILEPQWLATLLKQMSTNCWHQTLQIIDLILLHSQVTLSNEEELTSLKSGKLRSSLKYFTNKPDIGSANVSQALESILSTEQRKRSVVLDKSFFKLFEESNDESDEQLEVSSDSTKSEEVDGLNEVATSISAASMGRFPTFRGFEELLNKLESLPSSEN